MMLVQLAASGSAVGNSAEWSPALRREPTGVNLNIGVDSSLLDSAAACSLSPI